MNPNFKMSCYHQREQYLERSCSFQTSEKLARKPCKESMEGFEYSSLLTSKTYSILSYVVGGFVGSKSQMNNKHNLSYDLCAAIFNLLNPCKYEREKSLRKSTDGFYNTAAKLSSEGYDKYIVKSSHKGKASNLGLEWLENHVLDFDEQCCESNSAKKDYYCDGIKDSSESLIAMEIPQLNDCLSYSVDVTDRVPECGLETLEKECCLNSSVSLVESERIRLQSECSVESTDSESFIVFDGPDEDSERKSEDAWKLEIFDFDTDDEEEEDDEDESSEEEEEDKVEDGCMYDYEYCRTDKELAEANDKWLRNYENVETGNEKEQRKVRFNDDVKINKIVAWDYAYRAARAGPWEQMARDRARFRERILRLAPVISSVLRKEHRDKIYKDLYS